MSCHTHRAALGNERIWGITKEQVIFSARVKEQTGEQGKKRTLRMPAPNPVAQENAQTLMARVAQINTSQCPACAHGRLHVVKTLQGQKRLPDSWACKELRPQQMA